MDKQIRIKKLMLLVALFIIGSGVGSIIFQRFVLPPLSALPLLRNVKILDSETPIIITRREEIRIDAGVNIQEVLSRAKGALVKIYERTNVLSGVIVTNDGLIVAPSAGLKSGAKLTVVSSNGTPLDGIVAFTDELSGLAFLKIQAKDLPVLNEARSVNKNPGEALFALSLEESLNVSVRSVLLHTRSAAEPSISRVHDLFRFNAGLVLDPTLPSTAAGSVIVDKDGSLVGFVVNGKDPQVIRTEDLKIALSKFLESGDKQIIWPRLAVNYLIIAPSQARILELPAKHGVVLRQGTQILQAGGFIHQVDGRDISLEEGFEQMLFAKKPGEKVKFKLLRQGKQQEIEI